MKAVLYDDSAVSVEVIDKGCGIEDVEAAQEKLFIRSLRISDRPCSGIAPQHQGQ